jgi:hypothetical protein
MTLNAFIFTLVLACIASHEAWADFGELKIDRQVTANGTETLCYSPIENPAAKICLQKTSMPETEVPQNKPQITELRLTSLALGAGGELFVDLQWKGKGAGMLAISGPEGELILLGKVTEVQTEKNQKQLRVKFDRFFDGSLSQQFDRGTAFGIADGLELNRATEAWLVQAVTPVLEKWLNSEKKNPSPRPVTKN